MIKGTILAAILAATAVKGRLAFYNQREVLYLPESYSTPPIELSNYFQSRPLVFGLVSNKTRSYNREGYLCYAETLDDYKRDCLKGSRRLNAQWVSPFLFIR